MNQIIGLTGAKGAGKDTAAKYLIEQGWTKVAFAEPLKGMVRAYLRTKGRLRDALFNMVDALLAIQGVNDFDRRRLVYDPDYYGLPTGYLAGKSTLDALRLLEMWGRQHIGGEFWQGGVTKEATHPDIIERMIEGDLKEAPAPEFDGKSPRLVMQTIGTEWGRMMMHPDFWMVIARGRIRIAPWCVVTDVRFENEADLIHELGGQVIRVVRPGTGSGDHHASEKGLDDRYVDHSILNAGTVGMLHEALVACQRSLEPSLG